tara:strand:- start:477 stop:848 length:372 start_codon:yes stop_codon:yes gene_type:complete
MSLARNIANLPSGVDAAIYACRAYIVIKNNSVVANKNISSVAVNTISGTNFERYVVAFVENMPDANYLIVTNGYSHYGGSGEGPVGLRIDPTDGQYPSVSGFTLTYQSNSGGNLNLFCAGVIT